MNWSTVVSYYLISHPGWQEEKEDKSSCTYGTAGKSFGFYKFYFIEINQYLFNN